MLSNYEINQINKQLLLILEKFPVKIFDDIVEKIKKESILKTDK